MTVKKKKKAAKATAATGALSYKDVMIRFLAEGGVSVLDELNKSKLLKPDIARRACRALSAMSKGNAASFEAWLTDNMPASNGRGREAPHLGEEREYKAQQIKTGGAFLRLPLTPLGIKKSQKVKVRFEADRVVVVPVAA